MPCCGIRTNAERISSANTHEHARGTARGVGGRRWANLAGLVMHLPPLWGVGSGLATQLWCQSAHTHQLVRGSSTSFRCFRATHFHRLRHSRRIRFYCQGRECMVAAASRAVTPLVRGAQQATAGTHLNRRGSGPAWRAISTRPKGQIVGPRCKLIPNGSTKLEVHHEGP